MTISSERLTSSWVLSSGWSRLPAARARSSTISASFSVYGLVATARLNAAWKRAVAMSCMVRVILRMLRTALRRLTRTRRLAICVVPFAPGGGLGRRLGRLCRPCVLLHEARLEIADDAADPVGERVRQLAGPRQLFDH